MKRESGREEFGADMTEADMRNDTDGEAESAADTDTGAGTEAVLRSILSDLLGLSSEQVAEMDEGTELFGAIPELDSMAVAGLLTEMEDRLDILIEDEDVDAELFETFGNLTAFAKAKVSG